MSQALNTIKEKRGLYFKRTPLFRVLRFASCALDSAKLISNLLKWPRLCFWLSDMNMEEGGMDLSLNPCIYIFNSEAQDLEMGFQMGCSQGHCTALC